MQRTRPWDRFHYQHLDQFEISNKGNVVLFHLKLPLQMCIHLMFYISLLEYCASSVIPNHDVLSCPPIELINGPKYEVKEIQLHSYA